MASILPSILGLYLRTFYKVALLLAPLGAIAWLNHKNLHGVPAATIWIACAVWLLITTSFLEDKK